MTIEIARRKQNSTRNVVNQAENVDNVEESIVEENWIFEAILKENPRTYRAKNNTD